MYTNSKSLPVRISSFSFTLTGQATVFFTQRQYKRRRYRKLVNTHPQKCFRERKVGCKLAAYAYPCTACVSIFCRHLYQAKYRLVVRVRKLFQRRILSVAGKRVLREVVCAHAEKNRPSAQACRLLSPPRESLS